MVGRQAASASVHRQVVRPANLSQGRFHWTCNRRKSWYSRNLLNISWHHWIPRHLYLRLIGSIIPHLHLSHRLLVAEVVLLVVLLVVICGIRLSSIGAVLPRSIRVRAVLRNCGHG